MIKVRMILILYVIAGLLFALSVLGIEADIKVSENNPVLSISNSYQINSNKDSSIGEEAILLESNRPFDEHEFLERSIARSRENAREDSHTGTSLRGHGIILGDSESEIISERRKLHKDANMYQGILRDGYLDLANLGNDLLNLNSVLKKFERVFVFANLTLHSSERSIVDIFEEDADLKKNIKQLASASATQIAWTVENFHFSNEHNQRLNPLTMNDLFGNGILLAVLNSSIVTSRGELLPGLILELYRIGSEFGNSTAQFRLGVIESFGYFDPISYEIKEMNVQRAITHYFFGALNGGILSQMALGFKHMHGLGVPKGCEAAVLYYSEAANVAVTEFENSGIESVKEAERLSLGPDGPTTVYPGYIPTSHHSNVQGSDQDVLDFYSNTAEKGDTIAQFRLGQFYFHGIRGAQRDIVQAMNYFSKAGESNDGLSLALLGNIYLNNQQKDAIDDKRRLSLAKHYFDRALGVFKSSNINYNLVGAGVANNGLGYMHLYGIGLEQNIPKALELFQKAGNEQENSDALYNLGTLYLTGVGVKYVDYPKALKHFNSAVKKGHTLSMHKLGLMHLHGIGVKKSCEVALSYFKLVAEKSDVYLSLLSNAKSLYNNQNVEQALQLYLMAAELGSEVAQNNAAFILDKGVPNMYRRMTKRLATSSTTESANSQKNSLPKENLETVSRLFGFVGNMDFFYQIGNIAFEVDLFLQSLFWKLISYLSLNDFFVGLDVLLHAERTPINTVRSNHETLRLLYLAAEQGNTDARVKIGDYYFYDLVDPELYPHFLQPTSQGSDAKVEFETVEESRLEVAAYHYKKASERKNGQALFNLGYMYQSGTGLPKDFPLAKRYYDDAKASSTEALFPASLALLGLQFHMIYDYAVYGGKLNSFPTHIQGIAKLMRMIYLLFHKDSSNESQKNIPASTSAPDDKVDPSSALFGLDENGMGQIMSKAKTLKSFSFDPSGFDIKKIIDADMIVVIALAVMLFAITWYRQHRRATVNQQEQRYVNINGLHLPPEDMQG